MLQATLEKCSAASKDRQTFLKPLSNTREASLMSSHELLMKNYIYSKIWENIVSFKILNYFLVYSTNHVLEVTIENLAGTEEVEERYTTPSMITSLTNDFSAQDLSHYNLHE